MRNQRWTAHVFACERRGLRDRRAGVPIDQNPYRKGLRSNIQKQRFSAWEEGWKYADRLIGESAQERD